MTAEKQMAATIIKLDEEMFHHDSWKFVYFEVKRSNIKTTRHKTVPGWVFVFW